MRWTGDKPLPGGGFGRFSLKAKTNVVGGNLALSSVNLDLDGNVAEGVLSYAPTGRRTWQGTLAVDSLDLTPYVSTARLMTANNRDWNRMPIMLDGLVGLRSRPAPVGRPCRDRQRQARAHRGRGQSARRPPGRHHRREPGLQRRDHRQR